jgi:predicted HNH restriction endonuclease
MTQFADRLESVWPSTAAALGSVFTTQDYVEALKRQSAAEWGAIVARHGPGGRGSGNFYSPANIAFNFLKRKAAQGMIFRRQFVPSNAGWGSHVVAQWERVSSTASLPPDEGDLDAIEGQPTMRQHLVRERAIGLRPRLLTQREKKGLSCDCCRRSEPNLQMEMQRAIFEVHHKIALAAGVRKTTLAHLDLLCAACHRLIHRAMVVRGENVTAAELRKMLESASSTFID